VPRTKACAPDGDRCCHVPKKYTLCVEQMANFEARGDAIAMALPENLNFSVGYGRSVFWHESCFY
jgi:hypothetical protein